MSAKNKILINILILIVWISGTGMIGMRYPISLARPEINVTRTIRDTSVKFRAQNFPAGVIVEVLMGAYGTNGVNGVKVGTFTTSNSGTLRATVPIPTSLNGANRLDLRVQRKGYNGVNRREYYAHTSFANITTGSRNNQNLIPIQVLRVVKDTSVTIRINDLPANLLFQVQMATIDRKAGNLQTVGSFNSGSGGTLVATYNIPQTLVGKRLIFLIIQNSSQGYSGLAFFLN